MGDARNTAYFAGRTVTGKDLSDDIKDCADKGPGLTKGLRHCRERVVNYLLVAFPRNADAAKGLGVTKAVFLFDSLWCQFQLNRFAGTIHLRAHRFARAQRDDPL